MAGNVFNSLTSTSIKLLGQFRLGFIDLYGYLQGSVDNWISNIGGGFYEILVITVVAACMFIAMLVLGRRLQQRGTGGAVIQTNTLPLPQGKIWNFLMVYFPLLYLAEILTLGDSISLALMIHLGLILYSLLYDPGASRGSRELEYLFHAFPLISLFRIANIALPLHLLTPLTSIMATNSIVLAAILISLRIHPDLLSGTIKLPSVSDLKIWIPALIGSGLLGLLGFFLLEPQSLLAGAEVQGILGLSLTLIVFVALPEEIIFRGMLQRLLSNSIGPEAAILAAALVNMAMVVIWGSGSYMVFVFVTGIFIGVIFHMNRNLVLAVICHGVIESVMFAYPLMGW
jgi:membrane protease YdiL (CAAX protease family)